ncbi:RNA polymerase subunit sigma [Corallococcus sp. H22C18031201]|nr:RNA polymerase subunit sigma [Corallococcus sp. H22C18031201]
MIDAYLIAREDAPRALRLSARRPLCKGRVGMSRNAWSKVATEELLRGARGGERAALDELFRRCQRKLVSWAARSGPRTPRGGVRASDIAQDTALRAFDKFTTFNGTTEAELLAWLKRILANQSAQLARGAGRQKRSAGSTVPLDSVEAETIPSRGRSPSQVVLERESWRRLLSYLYALPAAQQDAIKLCHLDELPVAEVARRMGRTQASVAGLLLRGLRHLKSRMNEGAADISSDATRAALMTYLQKRDSGEKVDPEAFIAANPDCADELRAQLELMGRIRELRPKTSSMARASHRT